MLVQILVDLVKDQLKAVQRDNRRRNPAGSQEMHQRRYQPGRGRWTGCHLPDVWRYKDEKGVMKKFPNAVCALFDYLYLVIELGS